MPLADCILNTFSELSLIQGVFRSFLLALMATKQRKLLTQKKDKSSTIYVYPRQKAMDIGVTVIKTNHSFKHDRSRKSKIKN